MKFEFLIKNPCGVNKSFQAGKWACGETWSWWGGAEYESLALGVSGQQLECVETPSFVLNPGGSVGKESACNTRDPDSILGSGRSPREGNGSPLQHSCLENPMDREAWQAPVHGVAKESDLSEGLSNNKP